MIEFLSSWAKSLGLAIVIVSILEMLLPNNKTKKYVRMVMGIFVLFSIISPFIKNKDALDVSNFDIDKYSNYVETSEEAVNQTSMDKRIQELYIQELEKDITKKVEKQGYTVSNCKVEANISEEDESEITKIELNIKKNESNKETEEESSVENKLVEEVQKIRPIDTNIKKDQEGKEEKITNNDIQNIKKFLMEEYGVKEKCLKIN